jgi:hypothetical protein
MQEIQYCRPSPLRARRLLRGLRLRDVEKATDIPNTTLSRLERAELPLVGYWLTRLARFYAADPSALKQEMERFSARSGANR